MTNMYLFTIYRQSPMLKHNIFIWLCLYVSPFLNRHLLWLEFINLVDYESPFRIVGPFRSHIVFHKIKFLKFLSINKLLIFILLLNLRDIFICAAIKIRHDFLLFSNMFFIMNTRILKQYLFKSISLALSCPMRLL